MRAYIVGLGMLAPVAAIRQASRSVVPLVAGLTMVVAVHEPQGDYESHRSRRRSPGRTDHESANQHGR
jgi:hypothetical protein